jgi:hypothetical protein
LDKVKTPLSILFTPALGQLILGKVKERISPFFLNLDHLSQDLSCALEILLLNFCVDFFVCGEQFFGLFEFDRLKVIAGKLVWDISDWFGN